MKSAKVVGCSKDNNGNIIGSYDDNSYLNTMSYDVECPYGKIQEYAAKIIADIFILRLMLMVTCTLC